MGKKKKRILTIAVILIPAIPLSMWCCWWLTPKKKLVVAIIDKTMLTPNSPEHLSLIWVLNHERYTKTATLSYKLAHDYFGFFPEDNGKYKIKGLERFSSSQLEQLSEDCDLAYYANTYGIYYSEWQTGGSQRAGMLYGGMSQNDIDFLKKMKEQGKLIIAEFNTIASPTNANIRNQFEELFGIHWTGWTGRYFHSFDTTVNRELPSWLVYNYMQQHNNQWPFRKRGIAFVNLNNEIVILEDSTHLSDPMPYIRSLGYGQHTLHLPEDIKYNGWFDIMTSAGNTNRTIAVYTLAVNVNGARELASHGIPSRFPAVITHNGKDYSFYYFCGDFSDRPVGIFSSYFKGIGALAWLSYNTDNPAERKSFFWRFYRPMVTTILQDYYRQLQSHNKR